MNPNRFEEERHSAQLRQAAEAQFADTPAAEALPCSAEELLHELRVHQIELEMQNEELRRAQVAMEESRDRYADLYDFAPVGYLTLTREGMIAEINLTGTTLLGMERRKLLRSRLDAFVSPEDRDRWHQQFINMIKHEVGRQQFELQLKRSDGSLFYGRLDCLRIASRDEAPVIRIALTDIDELKHTENLLRASNERISDLLNTSNEHIALLLASTGEGIYAVDANGLCTIANPACAKLLGYAAPDELLGRDMHRLIHYRREDGSDYPVDASPVHIVLRTAQPASQREERFWRADGSSFPVELSAYPMLREGVVVGAMASFNDISARKRAEDDLRLLNANLEQRVREELEKNREKDLLLVQQSRLSAIGEVMHNVSHHWRQPLNTVSLVLANIKDAYEFGELNQAYLDREVALAQRLIREMSATIDRFRSFFTPDNAKRSFRVCDEVKDAVILLEPAFKSADIEIEIERSREAYSVLGYSGDFARAVLGIMTNARDAIIKQNIPGKIRIQTKKHRDTVTVSIRDNGGGVPENILDKIFDPFFTTHEIGTGTNLSTGLGLYLAKVIMNHMGGTIDIRNREDGTEVLLTLPLEEPDAAIPPGIA